MRFIFEEEINYMDDELVIKPCESDEEEEVEKKLLLPQQM